VPETPGYFPTPDGLSLYGVYHSPEQPSALLKPAVAIAPALFEERKSAYAPLTALARQLCRQGHAVLRFDYRGSGESGGEPGARRWAHLAADLGAACAALKKLSGAEQVAAVGLRLGATLALREAANLNLSKVAALAPVLQGAAQVRLWKMRSKIRSELTAGSQDSGLNNQASALLDFDGFDVAPGFFDDVAALDLALLPALPCPSLLVQLSHRAEPAPESAALARTLGPSCNLAALRLEPFWDRLDDVDTRALNEAVAQFLISDCGMRIAD